MSNAALPVQIKNSILKSSDEEDRFGAQVPRIPCISAVYRLPGTRWTTRYLVPGTRVQVSPLNLNHHIFPVLHISTPRYYVARRVPYQNQVKCQYLVPGTLVPGTWYLERTYHCGTWYHGTRYRYVRERNVLAIKSSTTDLKVDTILGTW